MKRIAELLMAGVRYFSSGTINSEQFHEFFDLFKKAFTTELRKLGATSIEFSKGHFYLSGFFKVGEQHYYFSISDVRHGFGFNRNEKPEMLIRTAQHNKDYTGGSNRYVEIKPGIHRQLAYMFSLEVKEPAKKEKKPTSELVAEIIKAGGFEGRIPSVKQAERIGFELLGQLGLQRSITETKLGRTFVCAKFENDKAYFYYDAQSKRLSIEIR